MLVQFRLKNFMSVRDEQVFSLVAASGLKEKDESLADSAVTVSEQLDLVKTAVVYGANASGKSNLLRAIAVFVDSIGPSSLASSSIDLYNPFILDQQSATEPTLFEAVFVVNDVTYRYGFEVQQQMVISEWLFTRRKQETYVFERKIEELRVNRHHKKLQELHSKDMIGPSTLLLNLGALFNDETCQTIHAWASTVRYVEGTEDNRFKAYTIEYLQNPENKQRILDLIRFADLGIEDIELIERPLRRQVARNVFISHSYSQEQSTQLPLDLDFGDRPVNEGSYKIKSTVKPRSTYEINTIRVIWNDRTNEFQSITTPLASFESQGTQKFFNLVGLILMILDNGGILVADELDTKLHPLLTQRIVQLFNSPVTNPRNAQFVFATHDTNLLSAGLFRRDQIWFTEKNARGATQLYALTDYKPGGKTVRNDEQLEKNYIAGKYGGIPYLGNFDALFEPKFSIDEVVAHE